MQDEVQLGSSRALCLRIIKQSKGLTHSRLGYIVEHSNLKKEALKLVKDARLGRLRFNVVFWSSRKQ